jgi:hypothetical protein
MTLFVISIIIGLVVLVTVIGGMDPWDGPSFIMSLLVGAGVGFGAWIGSFLGLTALANGMQDETYQYTGIDIVALQDGNATQGSFFLGTGVIDSTPKYTFYINESGAKQLVSIDANDIRVYDNADHPYVVRQHDCELSWGDWFAVCMDSDRYTEVHVPAGTIRSDYVLDAK